MEVFPSLPSETAIALVGDMNTRGYGVAENCISPDALASLRRHVQDSVSQTGGEYIAFGGPDALRGTFLQEMARSANFQALCRDLYRIGTHKSAPPVSFYQLLRCLAGKTGQQNAWFFHYDSYVLTVLVPILIPTEGQPGDLILFPNTRPIRKTYLGNLIDKILLDNALTQFLLRKGVQTGRIKPEKIRMTPGNVYFFWGCRSVHTNEPCDPDKIRATALFHYVDPHAHSWLRKTLLRLRNRQPLMTPVETGIKIPQPA
ncbi:MAG: hypothetical protein NVV72_02285 [Asticcacaulis sp.]|nr:hypothetical protein [Asticcacaulis sp.]